MRLTEHLDKISWSIADKFLFVIYGVITIVQFEAMAPEQMGLFGLLFSIFSWIFIISDSFALQNIIQFGTKYENRPHVNFLSLSLHVSITLGLSLLLFLIKAPLANLFSEPRLVEVFTYLPLLTLLNIPRTYSIKVFYRDTRMAALFASNLIYFGVMSVITLFLIFTKQHIDFNDIVLIYLVGTGLSAAVSLFLIKDDLKLKINGETKIADIIQFSTPYMLSGSLHLAPRQLDIYIIQFFFQTQVVGIYFLAKNLFRVFEEIVNAAQGLTYPAAVRQIAKKDFASLNDMMTKSISFILFFNLACVIALNFGLTELLVKLFLSEKYFAAIPMFNVLTLVSLGLPFTILGGIITAYGKPKLSLAMIAISLVFWFVSFYFVGNAGDPDWLALPHIIYYCVLSALFFAYSNKHFDYKFVQLFRFFHDSVYFIKNRGK